MAKQSDDTEVRRRPFADFLRDQSKGKTHEELTNGLHDLIARIQETGKKGRIQLTITVEPNKKNEDALLVTDEIRLVLPQPDRKASIFYADDDGNLTRTDPNQLSFDGPLREVQVAPAAQIKEKQA